MDMDFFRKQTKSSYFRSHCLTPNEAIIFDFINMLDRDAMTSDQLHRVQQFLLETHRGRDVINVVDRKGLTLLEKAEVLNLPLIVRAITANKRIVIPNHLCRSTVLSAVKNGHSEIMSIFLAYFSDRQRTSCFPVSVDYRFESSIENKILSSQFIWELISSVMARDNPDMLRMLLSHRSIRKKTPIAELLDFACQRSAPNCVAYLATHFPYYVEAVNNLGHTPLVTAVLHSTSSAIRLIENGALVNERMYTHKNYTGTVLHLYYRFSNAINVRLTCLIVDAGFKRIVDALDINNKTALEVLVSTQVGRSAPCQEEFNKQVIGCVRYLIDQGTNLSSIDAFEEMRRLSFVSGLGLPVRQVDTLDTVTCKRLLNEKANVLELLLSKCGDAKVISKNLLSLTNLLCLLPDYHVNTSIESFSRMYRSLAEVNTTTALQMPDDILQSVFCVLSRLLGLSSSEQDCQRSMDFVREIITLLISRGLDPRKDVLYNFKQIMIILNLVNSRVSLTSRSKDIIRIFVQNGVTLEDITKAPDFHVSENTLMYYVARAFYIQANNDIREVFSFFSIFINTFSQDKLTEIVDMILCVLNEKFSGHCFTCDELKCELYRVRSNARSLQQLARIRIGQVLEWQLLQKCPLLPLPESLITYVIQLE